MATSLDLGAATLTGASSSVEPSELISNPHSLHRAVAARRAEYVRPHRIRVKVGTWNVAAKPGTDKDLARWFVEGEGADVKLASVSLAECKSSASEGRDVEGRNAGLSSGRGDGAVRSVGGDKIGLYVLGLQEAADLYGPGLYIRPMYSGVEDAKERWRTALEQAMPEGYQLISSSQLAGLLLLVYASAEVAPTVSNVSSTTVGTGLMGLLGNKGAVATRIVLGETTKIVFVNCHLASGHDQTAADRRVWDVQAIVSRVKFDTISFAGVSEDEGDSIGDEDFAFWFGDLNFRLEGLPGDDIRRLLSLHSRGQYAAVGEDQSLPPEGEGVIVGRGSDSIGDNNTNKESIASLRSYSVGLSQDDPAAASDHDEFDPASDPHNDPVSLQATLDSLLTHDQLARMMKERKVFHDGWREGPITFLPSYKYDVGTVDLFDSSEKQRAPSWCDRILYRTRADRERYQQKVKDEEEARARDEEMKARGMEDAAEDDSVLFDYDPEGDMDTGVDTDATVQPYSQPPCRYDEYHDDEDANDGEQVVTNEGSLDRIQLDIYTTHQRITSSDHKPVVSVFTLDYDAVVPELKAKVHAEVARELDRAENEGRPGVTIVVDGHVTDGGSCAADPHPSDLGSAVDFGEVKFRVQQAASLTLANTGRVPATFSFVDKPGTVEYGETLMSPWLTTSFSFSGHDHDGEGAVAREVTLEPGETVQAILKAYVGEVAQARLLNEGSARLEEVLVLRVEDGRDHFIPVRARWSPTVIGRSIEELVRVPEGGVRLFAKSQAERFNGHLTSISNQLPVQTAVPRELLRLIEALQTLTERALADAQMLDDCKMPTAPGWPFDPSTWSSVDTETQSRHLTNLLDTLDNGEPVLAAFEPEISSVERLEAVSDMLLLFLSSLRDGIITTALWTRIEQAPLAAFGAATSSTNKQRIRRPRMTKKLSLKFSLRHPITIYPSSS